MNKSKILFFLFIAGLIAVASCKKDDDDGGDGGLDCDTVKFSTTIAAILENSCTTSGCHDVASINGDYTTYAGIETFAKNGTLELEVITEMTMPKAGDPLTQTQLDQFQCWIDDGAPDN
ncbi:MAG: hypothetical protein AB8F94_12410 [Saprospiraceae bacterium]